VQYRGAELSIGGPCVVGRFATTQAWVALAGVLRKFERTIAFD
jgi:hypothetical protein